MRSATPKQLRIKQSSGSTWSTVAGQNLGDGTNAAPANPSENMAPGFAREVGYMYNATAGIKGAGKVATYRSAYIAATGTLAVPTGPADVAWTYLGRLDQDGSIVHTPRSRTDAALVPVFRGVTTEVIFNVLDVDLHADIIAFNNTLVDIALERTDGTYRWFKGLWMGLAGLNPQMGTDRVQTVRVRATVSAFDITDIIGDALDAIFTTLDGYQRAGDLIDLEYTFLDDSVVSIINAGFTIVPVESYAQAQITGYSLAAVGYGVTEGSTLTVSPAFP